MKLQKLMTAEQGLLEEIAVKAFTRDDIAQTYAFARVSGEEIDWWKVNIAIIDRWNLGVLAYIKSKAWELLNKWQEKR